MRVTEKKTGILILVILIFWHSLSFRAAMASSSASLDFSVRPNPLSIEITSLETTVKYRSKIGAAITNRGGVPVRDIKVYLELPDGLSGKNKPINIKILKAGSTRQTSWLVMGEEPGDYKIKVIAEGKLDGFDQLIKAEATTIISFVERSSFFHLNWIAPELPSIYTFLKRFF